MGIYTLRHILPTSYHLLYFVILLRLLFDNDNSLKNSISGTHVNLLVSKLYGLTKHDIEVAPVQLCIGYSLTKIHSEKSAAN
jgi:hypothetical protein